MKKDEKWKVKTEALQNRHNGLQTLITGLPPDKSSFFIFHLSFFNFQQFSIVIYLLLIIFFFSDAYAQQTVKGDNNILSFFNYHAGYLMKKNDSLLSLSKLYAQKIFSDLYAQQTVKKNDTLTGGEYDIKAGFIYNFANFTEWLPGAFEEPESAIQICFVSDKAGVERLSILNGKSVKKKKIIVTNKNRSQPFMSIFNTIAQKESDKDNINRCHILFIASENREFVREQLRYIGNKNILTIGETEDFTKMCGIIRLFQEGNRLKFEVNLGAAHRAGLKLGAPLLMSAEIVKGCE